MLWNLLHQLRPVQFARHVGAEGARRLLNPSGVTSYAQTGEDLLIASLLSGPRSGFYVDVGCHHPIRLSNTYLLYLRGLTGICIDANAEFGPMFRRSRPRDRFVHACVGSEGGYVEFNIFKDPALSSIGGRVVAGVNPSQYEIGRIVRMPVKPLAEVLTENGAPASYDLLSIDVEEHDFSALQSTGLDRFRPRLIVIELHDMDVKHVAAHSVVRYLHEFRYQPIAVRRSNAFFMSSD